MTFAPPKIKHELPEEYLAYMAKQRLATADFVEICNRKALEEPKRRLEYHQYRNEAILRQEGADHALSCMGYEWNATDKRFVMSR